MSNISLGLKAIQPHFSYNNVSNILEANLKMYYDWALLDIGAWTEVDVPTSGVYGGDFSRLRLVADDNYTDGCVWEAARKDFVWESGINYTDPTGGIHDPQPVGTPIVNGTGISTGYYVDYPNGRLIFNSAVPTTATVKLPYSYRNVQIYRADNAPWWREIQYNSHRVDSSNFLQSESGNWSIFGCNRVQLPAVVVEVTARGSSKGAELGSDTLWVARDVTFGILTETPWDRKNLMDIFSAQADRTIWLFNANTALRESPLDYRGMLTGQKNYPYFVSETGHRWEGHNCRMKESFITDVQQLHPSLYIAVVRTTMETLC